MGTSATCTCAAPRSPRAPRRSTMHTSPLPLPVVREGRLSRGVRHVGARLYLERWQPRIGKVQVQLRTAAREASVSSLLLLRQRVERRCFTKYLLYAATTAHIFDYDWHTSMHAN